MRTFQNPPPFTEDETIEPVVDDPARLLLSRATVLVAGYVGWGWLSLGSNELTPVLAVLMGVCQALTNWLAAVGRDLWRRGAYPAAAPPA